MLPLTGAVTSICPSTIVISTKPSSPVVSTLIGCKLERASAQIFERSGTRRYLAIANPYLAPNESRVLLHLSNLDVASDVRQRGHHYVRTSQNHRGRK